SRNVYAALWSAHRPPWSSYPPINGSGAIYRSKDGGANWTQVTGGGLPEGEWGRVGLAIARGTHGKKIDAIKGAPGGDDYHALWIDPSNPQRMIFGSDQGASVSVDGGQTWSSWYNQPTAQFYHVAVDNQFPYRVYGAQ